MDGGRFEVDGKLPLAFATWVYRLHAAGVDPRDPSLAAACADVDAAEARGGEAIATAFVEKAAASLVGASDPGAVAAAADALYDVSTDLGAGSRSDRNTRIRKYQFGRSLPWLARIIERHGDGRVGPSWLVVEQVTDQVRVMDPNPWNDVDERRQIPLADFHCLWELDGCGSIYVR